jgi:PKD repeat protein
MAINNAGDIVGSIRVGAGDHAALWPGDGSGVQDLGTLPGYNRTVARGINSSRRIVGYGESFRSRTDHALVWDPVPQQAQSITFASTPPNGAIVGGTYTVSATGGGSGNAVTFTSLTPTVCSLAGNVVSLNAGGTCTIAADQAGSAGYLAAPQVTQSFDVNTRPVANAGAAQSGDEGSTIAFNAGNSADADGDALIAYTWDFGDGTVQSVSSPTVGHIYIDNKAGGGAYAVTLQVTDARGATGAVANTSALIGNVAPVATFNAVSPVGEGTMNLSLTGAQDAPGDVPTLQHAFDCGNGTGYGAFSASASIACVVPDNGVRTVRAKIKDKDGAVTEYTKSVTVVNVAPAIAFISAPPGGKTGDDYSLQFRFTDPGTLDAPWSVQTIWGDGKPAPGPSSESAQGLTITQKHRYTKAGSYTITVRVTDRDGGTATSNIQVAIVK